MKEVLTTVTSKGQVSIPAEVRRELRIQAGDKLAFVIEAPGKVALRRAEYPTIGSLRGAAGSLATPTSWPEMRDIACEDALAPKR